MSLTATNKFLIAAATILKSNWGKLELRDVIEL